VQLPTSITGCKDAVVAIVKQRAMTFPPQTQYCEKACELTGEILTLVTCKKVTVQFLHIIPSENWFVLDDFQVFCIFGDFFFFHYRLLFLIIYI